MTNHEEQTKKLSALPIIFSKGDFTMPLPSFFEQTAIYYLKSTATGYPYNFTYLDQQTEDGMYNTRNGILLLADETHLDEVKQIPPIAFLLEQNEAEFCKIRTPKVPESTPENVDAFLQTSAKYNGFSGAFVNGIKEPVFTDLFEAYANETATTGEVTNPDIICFLLFMHQMQHAIEHRPLSEEEQILFVLIQNCLSAVLKDALLLVAVPKDAMKNGQLSFITTDSDLSDRSAVFVFADSMRLYENPDLKEMEFDTIATTIPSLIPSFDIYLNHTLHQDWLNIDQQTWEEIMNAQTNVKRIIEEEDAIETQTTSIEAVTQIKIPDSMNDRWVRESEFAPANDHDAEIGFCLLMLGVIGLIVGIKLLQ